MDMLELMRTRTSVRSFAETPLPPDLSSRITKLWEAERAGVPDLFDSDIRLKLLDGEQIKNGRLGTYGVIRSPQGFIAGLCPNEEHDLIAFGFRMERLLLALRGEGIETCWLGGTFRRGAFTSLLAEGDGLIIPAVLPIGYSADRRGLQERIMRRLAGSDQRRERSRLFFTGDDTHPFTNHDDRELSEAMEMVRLAPSASNKQPWRLIVTEDRSQVDFYIEKSPAYNTSLGYPIQMLDMGIAMAHFDLAAEAFGRRCAWSRQQLTRSDRFTYTASCRWTQRQE